MVAAYSADIVATGYGTTPESAKEDAMQALRSTVFGTTVISGTNIYSSETKGSGSVSSFESTSSTLLSGTIFGEEYSDAEKSNGKYKVTVKIKDSSHDAYIEKAKEAVQSIKAIYVQKTSDNSQQKAKLRNLMNALSDYSNYKQILIRMGYSSSVPDHGLDITFQSVYSQLESVLIDEENSYRENMLTDYSGQIANLLEENRKEQEQMRRQKSEALLQAEAMNLARINEKIQQAMDSAISVDLGGVSVKSASFEEMKDSLEKSVSAYRSICDNYTNLRRSELTRIESELKWDVEAIRNKAYRIAELDKDGRTPTLSAKALRDDEIRLLTEDAEKAKQKILDLLELNMRSNIQQRYDECMKLINAMESTEFTVGTNDSECKLNLVQYNGTDCNWEFRISNKYFNLPGLLIGYKDISGEDPKTYKAGGTKKDRDKYNEYIATVDGYNAKLMQNPKSLVAFTVYFRASLEDASGDIRIEVSKIVYTTDKKRNGNIVADGVGFTVKSKAYMPNYQDITFLKQTKHGATTATAATTVATTVATNGTNPKKDAGSAGSMTRSFRAAVGYVELSDFDYSGTAIMLGADIDFTFLKFLYLGISPEFDLEVLAPSLESDGESVTIGGASLLLDFGLQLARLKIGVRTSFGKQGRTEAWVGWQYSRTSCFELGVSTSNNPTKMSLYGGLQVVI